MVAVKKEWMFLEFFIIIKNYTSFSKLSLFSPIIKKIDMDFYFNVFLYNKIQVKVHIYYKEQ